MTFLSSFKMREYLFPYLALKERGLFQILMSYFDVKRGNLSIDVTPYAVKHQKTKQPAIHSGIFTKNLKFGHVSLKMGDFEIKREDRRQPLKMGVSCSKREGWTICFSFPFR